MRWSKSSPPSAARGHDLEHAARQAQDGDVERAAAQVVDRVDALRRVIQPVGDGGSGRFVQQAQDVEAGQPCGVLGRLALCVVEIGRDGDHGADQLAAERRFAAFLQDLEDFRRDFDRTLDAGLGAQPDHARAFDEIVGHRLDVGDVLEAAPHEALDRDDGVLRVERLVAPRLVANLGRTVGVVMDDRRQQGPPLIVVEADGDTGAYRGDQRIGGAEVDADSELVFVRGGGFTGFGDLEQGHVVSFSLPATPARRRFQTTVFPGTSGDVPGR